VVRFCTLGQDGKPLQIFGKKNIWRLSIFKVTQRLGGETKKMNTTKIRTAFFVAAIFLFAAIAPVSADWDEGYCYKMHYPQLPDPQGWDVYAWGYPYMVADDWQCTETGPVTDIHIWGSWASDNATNPDFHLEIRDNFSWYPGNILWQRNFTESDYTVRWNDTGPQGFLYPGIGSPAEDNHNLTFQYNFYIDFSEAFEQQEGNIYWLVVSTPNATTSGARAFGVKTTTNDTRFGNTAVFWVDGVHWVWEELNYAGEPLDLAFVINSADVIPPQITCPADVTVNTDPGVRYATGVALGNLTVTDNCDPSPIVTNNAPSQFPLGTTIVIWKAVDASGNSAACAQTVTVLAAPPVPVLTPTGIIALVSLLSAIAAVAIVRKRR
jgi:hypothetical protein